MGRRGIFCLISQLAQVVHNVCVRPMANAGITIEPPRPGHAVHHCCQHFRCVAGFVIAIAVGRSMTPSSRADVLLCESTYGDRDHEAGDAAEMLQQW